MRVGARNRERPDDPAFTATCLFLSIGVFLAHAFDVYRMR